MQRKYWSLTALCLAAVVVSTACRKAAADPQAEAPPPLKVQRVLDRDVFTVENPALFPVVEAAPYASSVQLQVTGTVTPDVSRNVPVISLASGRVLEIRTHLGDQVTKGQLLMRIESTDIASAYSDFQQAQADETVAAKALARAQDLSAHGAMSRQDLELAQATETKAQVTLRTATDHLRLLGADPEHPSPVVDIAAPVSGIVTDQQVTGASGVQALSTPSPFTISDLSNVWVLCDVFENDLANVRIGDRADIRLNAYPDQVFMGTIANIGPILDPNIRTAKVRVVLPNPGTIRLGMFVTATFHGPALSQSASVPADAVLHLHDREWVYVPAGGKNFRRIEVHAGDMLPGNRQQILSGIAPGQLVIGNALELETTVQQ